AAPADLGRRPRPRVAAARRRDRSRVAPDQPLRDGAARRTGGAGAARPGPRPRGAPRDRAAQRPLRAAARPARRHLRSRRQRAGGGTRRAGRAHHRIARGGGRASRDRVPCPGRARARRADGALLRAHPAQARLTAPRMAVHRSGRGPALVLFHGGMGSWKHWIRNVEPLAERFTVHALDHPSYGDSASVPRETTGPQYLDLVLELILELLPGEAPLRFAGFSFGAAIAANLARRLGPRVTHLGLISPGGFPMRKFGERPIRSYKEGGGDERLFREICRHNLLVNMLSDPASVS